MPQLFKGRNGDAGRRLDRELESLEKQIEAASPGYETQYLNRAGNLCVDAGEAGRALGYFGRAIDSYLEAGRFSAAEVVCRKVLQIAPGAVRARCTLAWLSIGRGDGEGPAREIAEYVEAARRAERTGLAVKQLTMMAGATPSPELRMRLADHLLDLGEAQEADLIYGQVFSERNGTQPPRSTDEGKLWAKLLRAALMGPEELRERAVSRGEEAEEPGSYLPALMREQ